jgi:GT2 family glycosyltransferase
MNYKSDIAVAILNYNGLHFLEKFLGKMVLASPEADLVLIDNASTDTSLNYVLEKHPEVIIIKNTDNHGYAGGYNEGLKNLPHAYFVLINSDVEVKNGWLKPLIERLKSKENIAAVQPLILDQNKPDYFEYAGAAGGFIDKWGYTYCRGRIFDTCEKNLSQYPDAREVFWATGACLAIKAAIFHENGGFDPAFFAHMEEIDLCYRLKNQAYEIWVEPKSQVYHVGAGTLKKENAFKTYLNYRNNLAMLYKNLPSSVLVYRVFIRLILDGISSVRFLTKGQWANIWAIVKAHFAFYAMIPKLKRSEQFLAEKDLNTNSIIWAYFVKGKKTFKEL